MKKTLLLFFVLCFAALASAKTIDISLDAFVDTDMATLSVIDTSFDWVVDENNLCTVWSVYSEDTGTKEQQCLGDGNCCFLANLNSEGGTWYEDFNVNQGKLGATINNQVSAQVISADYSLDPSNPFADITYSSIKSVPVSFSPITLLSDDGTKITLRIFHGSAPLDIQSLAPTNEKYHNADEDIGIDYFVFHEGGTEVDCALVVDGTQIITVEDSTQTELVDHILDLSEGPHNYKLTCTDSSSESTESEEKSFIQDYTPPQITLLIENGSFSFTDQMVLNYSVTDNLANTMDCRLFVDGVLESENIVQSGVENSITVSDLENGTHEWMVSCTDEAGNTINSSTRTFNIDVHQDFSFTINQNEFDIGQSGYYIITAPFGAEVTLLVNPPDQASFFRFYTDGAFPVLDQIDFTQKPGTYRLEAVMTYLGGVQTHVIEFTVTNSLEVDISASESVVRTGQEIEFNALVSGGIGDATYEWDFGDGGTSSDKRPKHTFSQVGDFDVKLRARDSVGNVNEKIEVIQVKNVYDLQITVNDETGNPISGVAVFVDDDEYDTNGEGRMGVSVLEGEHDILLTKSGFVAIVDEIDITEATQRTYTLESAVVRRNSNGEESESEGSEEAISEELLNELVVYDVEEAENKLEESNDESIASLDQKITKAIEDISDLNAANSEVANELGVLENLQKAKQTLKKKDRDLFGLKYFTEDKVEERREEIEAEIKEIEETTIVGVEVKNSEEYSVFAEDELIKKLLDVYFESAEKEKEDLIELNTELQKNLLMFRTVKSVELEFLSGKNEEITLVSEKLKLENEGKSFVVIENIPEELAEDIEILVEHQKEGNVVHFDPSKVDQIVYFFRKALDPEETKEIGAVLVDPLLEPKKRGLAGISGMAIFSSLSGVEDPVLVIQIALIVLLIMIYVFYEFEILLKIRQHDSLQKMNPLNFIRKLTNKDLHELHVLVKKAEAQIHREDLGGAEDTYHNLIKIYNDKLSSDLRKKSIDKISSVYNELLIHRILKSTRDIKVLIKDKQLTKAKDSYEKMQELYKQLPKSWKVRVTEKCTNVFKMLSQTA